MEEPFLDITNVTAPLVLLMKHLKDAKAPILFQVIIFMTPIAQRLGQQLILSHFQDTHLVILKIVILRLHAIQHVPLLRYKLLLVARIAIKVK